MVYFNTTRLWFLICILILDLMHFCGLALKDSLYDVWGYVQCMWCILISSIMFFMTGFKSCKPCMDIFVKDVLMKRVVFS